MKNRESLSVGFLFDDTLDSSDGVAQYVKTLGAWLASQGHQISYLVGETKLSHWAGGKVYSLSRNQTVNFNGNKLSVPLPGGRSKIKNLLISQSFDVLHVMVPYSPFMSAQAIKYAKPDTAIVGTFHIFPSGALSITGSKLLRIMLAPSLKKFNRFVSVSQPAADFAATAFGIKSAVVPNPVDLSKFRAHATAAEKSKQIVFLGRLVKRKGAAQLIDAFGILAQKDDSARLVIAGSGPELKNLKRSVVQLGIGHKVDFLGYIDESDKPALLAGATIACFPSLYGESFGIVLVEAMAAGAGVVIGGNNPGYISVLGQKADLIFDPTDTQQFADRLEKLLGDDALKENLHKWQQSEVKQYNINVVGPQIEDLYSSAIARLNKTSHNKNYE
jgi:phosphatidyl-myo-inositol alpha-mannosyltransferase